MFHHVESSQIHSLSYDPVSEELSVRFLCQACKRAGAASANCPKCRGTSHTGVYRYSGVPVEAYAAVRDAKKNDPNGSHGKALNQHIKRGGKDGKGYPFQYTPHGGV